MSNETTGWAMNLVLAERQRQVDEEGYTASHDDEHNREELEQAARAYSMAYETSDTPPYMWPWSEDAWNPKDRLSNLVRAAALFLAESDRENRNGRVHRAQYLKRQADFLCEVIEREHERPDDTGHCDG